MNPMVPGLQGTKMSSSEAQSKIDLLDSAESIAKKIKGAFCEEGNLENNGVLAFVKMVIFNLPSSEDGITIHREEKHGGNMVFKKYKELEEAFLEKKLHPGDLKKNLIEMLNKLLKPIREHFQQHALKELISKAYPKVEKSTKQTILDDEEDEKESNEAKSINSSTPSAASTPAAVSSKASSSVDISRLDIRVGRIISCKKHSGADSLLVELIDFAESTGPRQVVSGLAKYYSPEQLENQLVVAVLNLKPTSMRGEKSTAMVLCACSESEVQIIQPNQHAKVGERVVFNGYNISSDLSKELPRANEKVLAEVLNSLSTNASLEAVYNDSIPFNTSAGSITCKSLASAPVR
jgi:tyrosyl-tRNA synthetase